MHNTLSHNAVFFHASFSRVTLHSFSTTITPHALHLGCRVQIVGLLLSWSSCWAFSFSLRLDTSFIHISLYNYTYIVKKVIDKVYVHITQYNMNNK